MLNFFLLNLMIISRAAGWTDDYWSNDFDPDKDCAQEEKIAKLQNQMFDYMDKGQDYLSQCEMEQVNGEGDTGKKEAFNTCKDKLATKVRRACAHTDLKSSGELLYCNDRRIITCCFVNHTCVKDWSTMQGRLSSTPAEYLPNPTDYLKKNVLPMGYKTCHVLNSSLDATICAKDCERLKEHKFGKDCKKKGGFFKCCIRRDKAFCNECRFCCTLPMCSYAPPGTSPQPIIKYDEELEELKDQKNKIRASDLFLSEQHIYKSSDYRCLVPYSDKDPTKWKTYEMHEFRRAFNEEKLKKVEKFKYDNNMFNWVDPKVLKYFTKSKNSMKKAWKKTYGFPYATPIPKMSPQEKPLNLTKCFLKCARYEKSTFAKSCRKRGGLFKCCVQMYKLDVFEDARNKLIKQGLIKDKPTSFCKPDTNNLSPCYICSTDAMCTEVDIESGKTKQTFYKGYKKHQMVGGPMQTYHSRFGLRFAWCNVADMCNELHGWYYDYGKRHGHKYREVASQKEVCKIPLMGDWDQAINYDKTANGKIQTNAKGEKQSAEMEQMKTEYHKYCPKSKSNNIIYCPKEIIKKKIVRFAEKEGMKLRELNKRFKRISKKRKSKKKKLRTGRKSDRKEKKKTKRKHTA